MTAYVRGVSVEGRSGSVDQDANHSYTATFKVYTDDKSDGASVVEAAFGLPKIGDVYSIGNDFDPGAFCVSKSADQAESPNEWNVTCTWDNKPYEIKGVPGNEAGANSNPLNDPIEITYGFQNRTIRAPGFYANPDSPPSDRIWVSYFFASNGEPFDPQPEIEISDPVMSIKKNVQSISPAAFMELANCVNSDWWQGAAPRQLKLSAPQASRKYSPVCGFYWEVTYSILFRYESWDIQMMNQGTFYWEGGVPMPITSADWNDRTKIKRKYMDGAIVTVNLTFDGQLNETSNMSWQSFRVYREIPFGTLGLI